MTRFSRNELIIRGILVLIGIVTTLPVLAIFDPATALEAGYGITNIDPMVRALLQHRGIFQFVLGTAICYAAFLPHTRIPIALAAIITKGSFLTLILPDGALRADLPLATALFDLSCILILATVALGQFRKNRLTSCLERPI